MNTKKILQETEHLTVDENGELIEFNSTKTFSIPNEPAYIKLYIQDVIKLKCLPKGNSAVLYELIKQVDYENEINLNPRIKKRICRNLNMTGASLNNVLSKLIKVGIILRIERGSFLLNPHLFAKGSWTDIKRLRDKYISLTITYKNGERTMKSSFSELT